MWKPYQISTIGAPSRKKAPRASSVFGCFVTSVTPFRSGHRHTVFMRKIVCQACCFTQDRTTSFFITLYTYHHHPPYFFLPALPTVLPLRRVSILLCFLARQPQPPPSKSTYATVSCLLPPNCNHAWGKHFFGTLLSKRRFVLSSLDEGFPEICNRWKMALDWTLCGRWTDNMYPMRSRTSHVHHFSC